MDDLVKRAREVMQVATPGRPVQFNPRYCEEAIGTNFRDWDTSHDLSVIQADGTRYYLGRFRHADDALFDQVARQLIPELTDRIEELEAENARLKAAALRELSILELVGEIKRRDNPPDTGLPKVDLRKFNTSEQEKDDE